MHACQDDLIRAAIQRGLNIEDDIRHRAASPRAARDGRDAERAVIVASVLHFDEGARAAMQAGQGDAGQRFKVEGADRGQGQERLRNELVLAVVRHDAGDARQFEGFLRL